MIKKSIGGKFLYIPINLNNWDYRYNLKLNERLVMPSNNYLAFPELIKVKDSLISIFSSGEAHANSTKQIMARSDDNGLTWIFKDFFINSSQTFDTSLLNDIMNNGDYFNLKVFDIKKQNGTISITINNNITVNGYSYAPWGKPIFYNSKWLRLAYGTIENRSETILIQSNDNGSTWQYVSTVASVENRKFSEAALLEVSGKLLAVIREDTDQTKRYLVSAFSNDAGQNWILNERFNPDLINGVQPHLIKISNENIILLAADRTGITGFDAAGKINNTADITGIAAWKSTDGGQTWSNRFMLAAMYSTDGGQPWAIQLSNNQIGCIFYHKENAQINNTAISFVNFDHSGIS